MWADSITAEETWLCVSGMDEGFTDASVAESAVWSLSVALERQAD